MNKVTPRIRRRTATITRPPILSRLLLFWVLLAVVAGSVLVFDAELGLSLLWGVSVSALPGACFAWYGYRQVAGARQTASALTALYRAETIKFLLTAALFAAVFIRVEQIHLGAFFLAFICAHLGSSLVTATLLVRRQG